MDVIVSFFNFLWLTFFVLRPLPDQQADKQAVISPQVS
jgi:hypothetical protein